MFTDGSFAKWRELSLSWMFPGRWIGAQRGSLTLAARNLHTWTGYTGLDPEAQFMEFGFTTLEQDNTPQLMSFMLTLNLTY